MHQTSPKAPKCKILIFSDFPNHFLRNSRLDYFHQVLNQSFSLLVNQLCENLTFFEFSIRILIFRVSEQCFQYFLTRCSKASFAVFTDLFSSIKVTIQSFDIWLEGYLKNCHFCFLHKDPASPKIPKKVFEYRFNLTFKRNFLHNCWIGFVYQVFGQKFSACTEVF